MKIWSTPLINIGKPRVARYAKTLYIPDIPDHIQQSIVQHTKGKLPHYFIYAKDKTNKQVESINNIGVNKLKKKIIKDVRIDFQLNGEEFDYTKLMFHDDVDLTTKEAEEIVETYRKLDLKKRFLLTEDKDDDKYNSYKYTYLQIRKKILEVNPSTLYVVDVLVKQLYHERNSKFKTTLWECFGDVIYNNIESNMRIKYKYCEVCGDLIEVVNNKIKYCKECGIEEKKDKDRIRMYSIRKKSKIET